MVSSSLFQIKSGELGPSVGLILEYQLLFPEREGRPSLVSRLELWRFWPAGQLARVDLDRRAGVSDI